MRYIAKVVRLILSGCSSETPRTSRYYSIEGFKDDTPETPEISHIKYGTEGLMSGSESSILETWASQPTPVDKCPTRSRIDKWSNRKFSERFSETENSLFISVQLLPYTRRNLFRILLNQIKFGIQSPFSDWSDIKRNSVWC